MQTMGVRTAIELSGIRNGQNVRLPEGDRPAASGNGEGFVFLSLEDETGSPMPLSPQIYFRKTGCSVRAVLMVEGILQNQDNVISVKPPACCHFPLPALRPARTILLTPYRRLARHIFVLFYTSTAIGFIMNTHPPQNPFGHFICWRPAVYVVNSSIRFIAEPWYL
jgi:hypothetical protein